MEVLIVLAITGVAAAMALPPAARTFADLRLRNDSRSVHNLLAVAKMRAAARFTRERLYVDKATEAFYLQYWDKTAKDWVTEGGSSTLSSGVDFGYGTITDAPPQTQTTLHESGLCKDKDLADITNTLCVTFNSRGIPITSDGDPQSDNAIYLKDDTGVFGITLSAS